MSGEEGRSQRHVVGGKQVEELLLRERRLLGPSTGTREQARCQVEARGRSAARALERLVLRPLGSRRSCYCRKLSTQPVPFPT